MNEIRKILVAVDFSSHSDNAVDTAIMLAKGLDAEVHVVHAFHLPIPLASPYEIAVPTPYLEETREVATKKLKEIAEKVAAAGLQVHSHMSETPAAPAIARAAEEIGADLVVMGTRGLTGVKHVLLGSVAERTMRLAPCSVLAVKDD